MQAAGFLRRVLALIYDSLVIVGIVLFLTLVLVFLMGAMQNQVHLLHFYNFLF